jgi:hypothetical protein
LIEEARRGVKSRVIRYDGFVIVDTNSILFPNLEACEEVFVFSMRVLECLSVACSAWQLMPDSIQNAPVVNANICFHSTT